MAVALGFSSLFSRNTFSSSSSFSSESSRWWTRKTMGHIAAKKIYGYVKDEKPRSSTYIESQILPVTYVPSSFVRHVVKVIYYPGLSSLLKEKPKLKPKPRNLLVPSVCLNDEKLMSSTNIESPILPVTYVPSSFVRPVVKVIYYPGLSSLLMEKPKPRSSLPSTNVEKPSSSLLTTNVEKPSSSLLATNMEKPSSSLLATNMEKPSKMRAFIKFKKLLRIRQTRADKQYKRSHQGNGWKKPIAGSSYSEDFIIHDEICIQANQPISATTDSGSGPSNTISSVSSIEDITKRVDLLTKKLALESTPKQDVTFHNLDWNYFFCWVSGSAFLAPPYCQFSGECCCVALARGYEYYVAVNKIDVKKHLTFLELWHGVSAKHLMRSGGIENIEDARKFMVDNDYVKDMVVHRRPSHDFEDFERLVDLLLARGPVVVVFDCLPSYRKYDGKDVFIPDDMECQTALYEKFPQHSVVLTGCGVKVSRGKVIEYWRTHDSQGADWGVEGFAALARHKGLITAAVEFKF